jgi:hypothetical protein
MTDKSDKRQLTEAAEQVQELADETQEVASSLRDAAQGGAATDNDDTGENFPEAPSGNRGGGDAMNRGGGPNPNRGGGPSDDRSDSSRDYRSRGEFNIAGEDPITRPDY